MHETVARVTHSVETRAWLHCTVPCLILSLFSKPCPPSTSNRRLKLDALDAHPVTLSYMQFRWRIAYTSQKKPKIFSFAQPQRPLVRKFIFADDEFGSHYHAAAKIQTMSQQFKKMMYPDTDKAVVNKEWAEPQKVDTLTFGRTLQRVDLFVRIFYKKKNNLTFPLF